MNEARVSPRGRIGPAVVGLLAAAFVAVHGVRDLPRQARRVRFVRTALSGLPNEKRRVEMFRPDAGEGNRPEAYFGIRRYLAFLRAVRRATPPRARVGLVGLESKTLSLERFAHYYLYPRLPVPLRRDEVDAAVRAGRVDAVAVLPPDGRDWEIRRVR